MEDLERAQRGSPHRLELELELVLDPDDPEGAMDSFAAAAELLVEALGGKRLEEESMASESVRSSEGTCRGDAFGRVEARPAAKETTAVAPAPSLLGPPSGPSF